MKTYFIDKNFTYDGEQLKSLYAYMNFGVMGDSIVAWIGPCNIPFDHMVDGEDVRLQSPISSEQMVHFICEIFEEKLSGAVSFQRLIASIVKDVIYEMTSSKVVLSRHGDDLYLDEKDQEPKKLSISIATKSNTSCLIHFAVNVTTKGTPVPTLSLENLNLEPQSFAKLVLSRVQDEFDSIKEATQKVRGVGSH